MDDYNYENYYFEEPVPLTLVLDKIRKFGEKPKLRIYNKSTNNDPSYATSGDSGLDLRAWITLDDNPTMGQCDSKSAPIYGIELKPLERQLIHTGIYCEIPSGYEIQVRPKSGQALKKGLVVLNTPGTIDSNYRGELCVIVINLSNDNIIISNGEKIAQAVLCPVCHEGLVDIIKVDEISTDTERGDGGFGHTGVN